MRVVVGGLGWFTEIMYQPEMVKRIAQLAYNLF